MKTMFLDFDARRDPIKWKGGYCCCHCQLGIKGKPKFCLLFRKENGIYLGESHIVGYFPFMISKESINEIPKEERDFRAIGPSCVKKIPKEFVFNKEEVEND